MPRKPLAGSLWRVAHHALQHVKGCRGDVARRRRIRVRRHGSVDLGFRPENLDEASGVNDSTRPRECFQPCDDDPRADCSGAAERGADRHVEATLRHGSGEDDGETIGVVGVTLYVGDNALKVWLVREGWKRKKDKVVPLHRGAPCVGRRKRLGEAAHDGGWAAVYHTDILAGVETPSSLPPDRRWPRNLHAADLPRPVRTRVELFCGLSPPAPRGTRGPRSHPRKPARADSSIRDAGCRRDAVVERAHRHVSGVVAFLLRGSKVFLGKMLAPAHSWAPSESDGFEARLQIHEFKNSSAGRSFKMPRLASVAGHIECDRE